MKGEYTASLQNLKRCEVDELIGKLLHKGPLKEAMRSNTVMAHVSDRCLSSQKDAVQMIGTG